LQTKEQKVKKGDLLLVFFKKEVSHSES